MAEQGAEPRRSRTSLKRARSQLRLGITLVVISVIFLIVAGLAGGYYLSFYAKVHSANGRMDPDIKRALETPPPTTLVTSPRASGGGSNPGAAGQDAAMDMLLLGSDFRPGVVNSPGNSDVIMLLHIDRQLNYLSILSITRDLYLDIPGYGMDRINAAYFHGGAALVITTLKQALGVNVTEYLGVGFDSFTSIIDSVGGAYVDVDRTYTPSSDSPIDLSAGYQLLDGANALLYSRYRFDDNADFGRMARQQRVLASLRAQARGWNKALQLPGMVNTVMDSATTNLSASEMLNLAYWLVTLDGSRIKQIVLKGPGKMIDGKAVVVIDQETLANAVTDFLTPPADTEAQTPSADGTAEGTPIEVAAGNDALSLGPAAPAITATGPTPTSTTEAMPTFTSTVAPTLLDAGVWQEAQKMVPFVLEGPTFMPADFAYAYKMPQGDGTYGIKVGDGSKPAVRMAYRYKMSDSYLGISATTWTEAPLASDGTVFESNGVAYTVVGTLGKPDHVWWTEDGVLYFVSNTLMWTLGTQDLLKIAESMRPVSGSTQ